MGRLKPFYVYLIRDPRPNKHNVPIYVGKGRGPRARMHLSKVRPAQNPVLRNIIAKCRGQGLEPSIEIIARFDIEDAALQAEKHLIKFYGRRDLVKGTLCNLSDGGPGPTGSLAVKAALKRMHADPIFKATLRERARKIFSRPATEWASPKIIEAWAPGMASRNTKQLFTNFSYRKRHSAGTKRGMQNPKVIEKCRKNGTNRITQLNADPIFAAANAERSRQRHKDPIYRAKIAAGRKAYWTARRVARLIAANVVLEFQQRQATAR